MPAETYTNAAQTLLAAAITTTSQTSISVVSNTAFPQTGQFRILIDSEIMLVSAGAGSNTWTVTRAAEAINGIQTASVHSISATVTEILTAGALANIISQGGGGGSPTFTSITITNNSALNGNVNIKGPVPWYDVKAYGCVGDGVTDDTVKFQQALDAARIAGGGVVFVPVGTYIVVPTLHPNGTWNTCLTVGNNVTLRGMGRGVSVIKMKAGGASALYNQASVLMNYVLLPGAVPDDSTIIEDITVDGNGANQNAAIVDRNLGLFWNRARRCYFHRVEVINVAGSNAGGNGANGTAGEGFGFEAQLCVDMVYTDCQYHGNPNAAAVSAATLNVMTNGGAGGFSCDQSTNVFYNNCISSTSAQAHGFTHWTCQNIKYVNCHSYLNRYYGYNSEYGNNTYNVQYSNCTAGGFFLTSGGGVIPPYASGQSLGNAGHGFRLSGSLRVHIANCISRKNGDSGCHIETNSTGTWVGGESSDQGNYGFNIDTLATAGGWRCTGGTLVTGNSIGLVVANVARGDGPPRWLFNGPAIPGSGVTQQNSFFFDAMVYITGGTVSDISIGAGTYVSTGMTSGTFHLPAGANIRLTYTVAPTWNWFLI